jgi:hypothetical protein
MQIVVKWDPRGLDAFKRATDTLGTPKVRQILHYALDQVGNKAATEVKRALVKVTGIKYGEIGKAIKVAKSSPSHLVYEITGTGRHYGLSHFSPVQTAAGVQASPWGTTRVFPHTFLIDSLGGNVFKHGEGRSIKKLWGPSIPVEMEREAIADVAFRKFVDRELPNAVDAKLKQYMP